MLSHIIFMSNLLLDVSFYNQKEVKCKVRVKDECKEMSHCIVVRRYMDNYFILQENSQEKTKVQTCLQSGIV